MASNRKSRGISMRTALLKALQKFFLLCGVAEYNARRFGRLVQSATKLPRRVQVTLAFLPITSVSIFLKSCHHAVDTLCCPEQYNRGYMVP